MEFLSFKKIKIFFMPHRGCVTKWYQSMVTTLDLLGLMDESLKNSIWSTFKKNDTLPYLFLKKSDLKMLLKKGMKLSTVCMHLRN
jgi:hypothetical protein